jgi:hypothetical protein
MLQPDDREARMRRGILAGMMLFGLGACVQAPGPTLDQPPAPEQQSGNTPVEDLDSFVVMIGAERWTVLIDRAIEGSYEAPESPAAGVDLSDAYRADAALKRGAAMVIELRNEVCKRGLVTGETCKLPPWPAWTLEEPTDRTSLAELDRRSAWLSGVMEPYVSAGCDAGRKAADDDMFCSVE